MKYKKSKLFTREERAVIKKLYDLGATQQEIALEIDRPVRSLQYELKRGYTGQLDKNGRKEYDPAVATASRKQIPAEERAEFLRKINEWDD